MGMMIVENNALNLWLCFIFLVSIFFLAYLVAKEIFIPTDDIKLPYDDWRIKRKWEIGIVDSTTSKVHWQNDFVQAATEEEAKNKAAARKGYYRNVRVRTACPIDQKDQKEAKP
jgi:hypothetical protein